MRLWRMLQLVRVYTKPPGKPADRGAPFVMPLGSTVLDLAHEIHQDLVERLQYVRLWGGRIDGQKVARDHELADRDTVELGV